MQPVGFKSLKKHHRKKNIQTNFKETPLQVHISGQGQVMSRFEVVNELPVCIKE
jgi:hypothetical protein